MTKIILKTIENIVYTGEYLSQSNETFNITNVESDNVQENERLQKAKEINTGMIFFKNNITWYTIK